MEIPKTPYEILRSWVSGDTANATIGSENAVLRAVYDIENAAVRVNILNLPTGPTVDTYWTSGSTGNYSVIAKNDSGLDATGDYAYAEGNNTSASGNYSHVEGFRSESSGLGSHAEGFQTTSSGYYGSHAEGAYTVASGTSSHTEGRYTTASGNYSHAGGKGDSDDERVIADGSVSFNHSYIENKEGTVGATGDYSSILGGKNNAATNEGAIVIGGDGCVASGLYSFATGSNTISNGIASHTEGYYNFSNGIGSHAEGSGTTASGNTAHAEGYNTIAQLRSDLPSQFDKGIHAEGVNTLSNGGLGSHAEGHYTWAYGFGSHAGGLGQDENSKVIAGSELFGGSAAFNHSYVDEPNVSGATADQSAILGGRNHTITGAGAESAILGGSNNTVSYQRSVVLGGSNITSVASDTVYVPNLNINSTPATGTSSDNILVRSANGDIKEINQTYKAFDKYDSTIQLSASAGSYQTFTALTFDIPEDGDYLVSFCSNYRTTSGSYFMSLRFTIDDTDIMNENDISNFTWRTFAAFDCVALTGTTHTCKFEGNISLGPGEVRNMRIFVTKC